MVFIHSSKEYIPLSVSMFIEEVDPLYEQYFLDISVVPINTSNKEYRHLTFSEKHTY